MKFRIPWMLALLAALAGGAAGHSLAPRCIAAQLSAPQRSPATTNTPQAQQAAQADPVQQVAKRAQAALDGNDFSTAIPLLQKLIDARPMEAGLHFELGYAYSELKRYDEAAAEYRRAIEIDPKLAAAHQNLGLALLDSSSGSNADPEAALAEFRQAAQLEPNNAQPRFLAGQALERANKPGDAAAEYQAAAALVPQNDPRNETMLFALGRALLEAGRAAEAETQFRALLKLQASDTSATGGPATGAPASNASHAPAANSSAGSGPGTGVGAGVTSGAALPPAALGLAEALVQEGKKAEAADAFATYLATTPNDRSAHYDRAALLHDLGRLDEALAELDRVDQLPAASGGLSGDFSAADELKLRGSIYIEQKKWTEASATLAKAVAAAPNDAEMHAWLGRARMELRDFPEAQSELQRALMLDATQADASRDLITVYSASGQYAAVVEQSDQLAQHTTPTAGDWFFRAVACDKLGRKADAAAAYQKFLDLDQNRHADQDFQAQGRLVVLRRELK